jgi:hypothetical protein
MSAREEREHRELLPGTLDLRILHTPLLGPTHGHLIAKALEFRSRRVLHVQLIPGQSKEETRLRGELHLNAAGKLLEPGSL